MTDLSDASAEPAVDLLGPLRSFGAREEWPPHATLLRQGERPGRLFVIEQGQVALWDESSTTRRLVQIVHAGASIGDLPVLLEQASLYTAVTQAETTTLAFTKAMVHDLLELNPQVCFLWLELLARRIERGYPRNVVLAGRSALERLGLFLLEETDANDGAPVELTRTELASATGLSRQRVSHVLGALANLGVVERERGGVRVVDRERLRVLLPR